MSEEMEHARLGEIAGRYDALACDVWGVVHNGREPFEASCAALARFRAERGPVVLITNSPRPSSEIPAQFRQIGVPDDICDAIVTSGDVTRAALAERAPGRVFKIGPPRDEPIYEGVDLTPAPLEEADFISCTGLTDDRAEQPEQYRPMLEAAAARGLDMVCANPDIVVHVGDQLIPCAGALAAIYRELGGAVIMAGKPHRPIYHMTLARLAGLMGREPEAGRVLAVGDGAATDVAGANRAGLPVLFVAGGIHREALTDAETPDMAPLRAVLEKAGAHARWAAPALVW